MIDLNSDLGESFGPYRMGADEALLGEVTSANIACGFHGGDPRTMDATVALAAARRVAVGAHVSYPDLVGFGRRHLRVSADELITDVLYQIGALEAFCRRHGTAVTYVKAHGALYNDLAQDEELAAALAAAVLAYGGARGGGAGAGGGTPDAQTSGALDGGAPDGGAPDGGAPDGGAPDGGAPDGRAPDGRAPDGRAPDGRAREDRAREDRAGRRELAVLVLAGSPAAAVIAAAGVRVVREGFADRGYTAAGRLVPRGRAGAVLTDPAAVAERGWRIATGAAIEADDGSPLVLAVDSLCVHGDTPGAVALARALRGLLAARAVPVGAFA
jgi:lactam utilization protein B